jgi:Tat protein translocase TatB subunit
MFNIGGAEFVVILLVALIVLGPNRLPEAARQAGKVMGEFRRMAAGFKTELKGALNESGVNPSELRATLEGRIPAGSAEAAVDPEVANAIAAATAQAESIRGATEAEATGPADDDQAAAS